jgi:hypothetical protein
MALKLDSDVKRVTVLKGGEGGGSRAVYRRRHDDEDDRHPIKRVTVIKRDGRGQIVSRDAYEGERRAKKQSKGLRPIERQLRKILEFRSDVIGHYLERHRRSNEKKRDGWLSDLPNNMIRAVRKSKPKRLLRVKKLFKNRD